MSITGEHSSFPLACHQRGVAVCQSARWQQAMMRLFVGAGLARGLLHQAMVSDGFPPGREQPTFWRRLALR